MENWIVTVTREHWGAGERWVYLILAHGREAALIIAKEESGYTSTMATTNPLNLPTGIWNFRAEELPPGIITEVSHSSWGGW